MRIANWGLAILLLSPLGTAIAQQQEQQIPQPAQPQHESLGDAARRSQDQKKDQPKPVKVWTNDNIPTATGNISIIGQTTDSTSDNSAPAQTPPPNPKVAAAQRAASEAELSAAKDKLLSLKTDLDIMQRKFTLDDQMYRGKPDYSSDKAGAAAMKDEKDQVDAKMQDVEDAQRKVDELQAKLAASAGDKSSDSK
jgi:hypothetical protein